MIILSSGSSVTLNLTAYNGFTVTSRTGATVLVDGVTTSVDGTTVFGLYSAAKTAVITALGGDCEYGLTFPEVGEDGKIYPDPVTGQLYRWDASGAYVAVAVGGKEIDVRSKGAKCDGQAVYDATSTASSTSTIGSATASFTSADIGKACAILPYTATGVNSRYGTITGVIDANTVTTSLNLSPGALSSATFVWGTDDGAAIDDAFAAAAASPSKGAVFFPLGITVSTLAHVLPASCHIRGVFNNPTGGKAKDFRHYGSSLVLAGYIATGSFVTLGDSTESNTKGVSIRDINIDCFNLAPNPIKQSTFDRTAHISYSTFVRGNFQMELPPTSRAVFNTFLGSNQSNVVVLSGDSTFTNNIVTGAGNGFYGIKTGNGDDILIAHNHIWKDALESTMLGGAIWCSQYSANVKAGSITIAHNKLDTSYGPHIKIGVSGNSTMRGISIVGNNGFHSDSVPDATYPYMDIDVEEGSSIRGLTIQNNTGRGSWNTPTKSRYTHFIDGSGIAGTVLGSNVGGNTIDNCDAMFLNFTPDHDGGNITIAGTGTVLTKSTTT